MLQNIAEIRPHTDNSASIRRLVEVPASGRVGCLTEADRREALSFLAVRPVQTVVMTSFILDNGMVSELHRGEFFGYRNAAGERARDLGERGELTLQRLQALRVQQQLRDAGQQGHGHEHDHTEREWVFALVEGGRARQDHGAHGAGDEDGNAGHVRFSEFAVPARAALSTSARSPDASSS